MCSRHSDHRSTRSAGPRSHGIEINRHTVEFSSNRRPNHSSRNLRSDRLRPGVVRSCCCSFFLSCFASDPSRSSAAFAISCDFLPFHFRLVSFAFRISDLSRSFPRPALPPGLRLRLGTSVPLRCSRTVSVLVSPSKSAVRRPFGWDIPCPDTKRPRHCRRPKGDDLTIGLALAEDHPG